MISYEDLVWSSSWEGHEVGYPEVGTVNHYYLKINPNIQFYFGDGVLLQAFYVEEEE